jgi:ATP-dependent Clp endopeptidase proteolytic subunit ClpP
MAKQNTSFYEIFNLSPETKTVDVMIYGAIPDLDYDTWEIKNTADRFVKDFKKLEKDFDIINIHINSPGGSLYHAFPIFNAIVNSKKEVHTYNDGLAASAGGVLLLAGKKIHSASNAFLMIHRASSFAVGNANQLRDVADTLEKYEGVIAEHFAKISGKTKDEIIETYFNGRDHFLTAEEALEAGFIHEILDYESEDAPPANISNMAFGEVMNLYRPEEKKISLIEKITNHIRNSFAGQHQPSPADPEPVIHQPTNNEMNFENAISILNKGEVTAEDLASIKASLTAYQEAGEKFTAEEVENKVNEITSPLTAEIDNLNTQINTINETLNSLTAEKANLVTEKEALATENSSLKVTVEAYRKSGVQPDLLGGDNPEPIPGQAEPENFLSETDIEIRKQRAALGL